MIWTSVQRELRRFIWTGGHTEGQTDSQANFHDENGGNLNMHNTKICGIVFVVRFFLLIWEVIEVFGAFSISLRQMLWHCPQLDHVSFFHIHSTYSLIILSFNVMWTELLNDLNSNYGHYLCPCFKARKWNVRLNLSTIKQTQAEG
jgi:hypothetical protein